MPTERCPRAKSDMTPCVLKDGAIAADVNGECVGCGVAMPTEPTRPTVTEADLAAALAELDGCGVADVPGIIAKYIARCEAAEARVMELALESATHEAERDEARAERDAALREVASLSSRLSPSPARDDDLVLADLKPECPTCHVRWDALERYIQRAKQDRTALAQRTAEVAAWSFTKPLLLRLLRFGLEGDGKGVREYAEFLVEKLLEKQADVVFAERLGRVLSGNAPEVVALLAATAPTGEEG